MIEVTKTITFDAAHRLSKHRGACRNIHGHTYQLAVTLEGEATMDDKVLDFKELSSLLKDEFVDGARGWDHALVLNPVDPLLSDDGFVAAMSTVGLRVVRMQAPVDPTAESMVDEVMKRLAICGVPLGHVLWCWINLYYRVVHDFEALLESVDGIRTVAEIVGADPHGSRVVAMAQLAQLGVLR